MYQYSKCVALTMAIFGSLSLACNCAADPKGSAPGTLKPDSKTAHKVKVPAGYEEAVKHYNRAITLHQTGFSDKAIIEYKAALQKYDRLEEAWCNLGATYFDQQNYKLALEAIEHASAINPDRPWMLDHYGQILFALGRDEEALTKFRRAIAVEPNFKSPYYNMADVLRRTGHDDEAKEVLKKVPK